jgi:hypothetical protein
MEDIRPEVVDEVCKEEAKKSGNDLHAPSPGCKMDVACFVLNRILHALRNSGRGRAHTEKSMLENHPALVDVKTLILEGFWRVASVPAPYHDNNRRRAGRGGLLFSRDQGKIPELRDLRDDLTARRSYLYADEADGHR